MSTATTSGVIRCIPQDAPAVVGAEQEQRVRHVSADRIFELWAVCEVMPAASSGGDRRAFAAARGLQPPSFL
ncbi:hypothetical protein [Nocardia sp. NPDC004604]|uniref:hypothetical protein n=1 Tax=Nocardia sp. NPDC004604 TaxID=3157013 RepID=UPI0033A75560